MGIKLIDSAKGSPRLWALCFVHNCLIHPVLPLAELADAFGAKNLARAVFEAHDKTVPTGSG